jgi:hypothetical protein
MKRRNKIEILRDNLKKLEEKKAVIELKIKAENEKIKEYYRKHGIYHGFYL